MLTFGIYNFQEVDSFLKDAMRAVLHVISLQGFFFPRLLLPDVMQLTATGWYPFLLTNCSDQR